MSGKTLKEKWMEDWLNVINSNKESNTNNDFSLFPVVQRVFDQTFSLDLKPVKSKAEIRKEKMKSILNNSLKRRIIGRIKRYFKKFISIFKKKKSGYKTIASELVSVKPLSQPSGNLFYINFKYKIDKKYKNKERLKKLNRIFKDLNNEND